MSEHKPNMGEWWMCAAPSGRQCPMVKTATGWGSILNKDGKPERDYIQTEPILTPLFKMVRSD